jgi:hypothetical protein
VVPPRFKLGPPASLGLATALDRDPSDGDPAVFRKELLVELGATLYVRGFV